MKIGYLDCASGISGDMMLGAMVDAGVPLSLLEEAVRSLGIPGLSLSSEIVKRQGFRACKVNVLCPEEHAHRGLKEISEIIDLSSVLTDSQKRLIGRLFAKIAEVEAKVHGIPVEEVHFHEVGAADSIADLVGAVVGLEYLDLDAIVASPVALGCGTTRIAHGLCPIPAPATAELLFGVPIAPSQVPFELTTPTGAAILSVFVREYGSIPSLKLHKIGYGAGTRDLKEQPNVLRLLIGEAETLSFESEKAAVDHAHHHHHPEHSHAHEHNHAHHHDDPHEHEAGHEHSHGHSHSHDHSHKHRHDHETANPELGGLREEKLWVLETNLDDTTGEILGYCIEKLWNAGTLDVTTTPIFMKKNRPAVTLTVLCREEVWPEVQRIVFRETSTLGIRRYPVVRAFLERKPHSVPTPWGLVEGKTAILPEGDVRFTPEFESAKKIAEQNDIPLKTVYEHAIKRFDETYRL